MEGLGTLKPAPAPADLGHELHPILVLGAAASAEEPSGALRARAAHAGALHLAGHGGPLLCSGLPLETSWMRHLLEGSGVDPNLISILPARTTRENLAAARRVVGVGVEILIVTCGYHLPRASAEAHRQRLIPIGRPHDDLAPGAPSPRRRIRESVATAAYRLSWHLPHRCRP